MADTIKHKRGTAAPTAANLVVGEVAINTAKGRLYTETDGAVVVRQAARFEEQFTATTTKTVTHNLGEKFVCVDVYDSSGSKIEVDVDLVDTNSLTLTFVGTLTNAWAVVVG